MEVQASEGSRLRASYIPSQHTHIWGDASSLGDYQKRATYSVLDVDDLGVMEQLLIPKVDTGKGHFVTGAGNVSLRAPALLTFFIWSIA